MKQELELDKFLYIYKGRTITRARLTRDSCLIDSLGFVYLAHVSAKTRQMLKEYFFLYLNRQIGQL